MSLKSKIDEAFAEDIPNGDLTTQSLKLGDQPGRARLVAREDLVLSGVEIFESCLIKVHEQAKVTWHFKNGDLVIQGQTICTIQTDLDKLLTAERVALNFLGHLSGIATLTRCYMKELEGTDCTLLDTRKTLPGLRDLEKKAVTHGHGTNHRMNLSDGIMLKENHIMLAGGITEAITEVRKNSGEPIVLETQNLAEVKLGVELNVARILLDNMSNEEMTEALALIPPSIDTEASGNMDLERLRDVALLGVNFISVGAITHSAPCADISLLFEKDR